ncbi:MAG: GGDEF domain-containing protein [Solirubrobacterales bacterium]
MNFRRRLTLTVLLIVVVPLLAIVIFFFPLSSESRTGKADARLAGALTPTLNQYSANLSSARQAARRVANDPVLGSAIPFAPTPGLDRRVRQLALTLGLTRLEIENGGGELIARFSSGQPVASVELQIRGQGEPLGTLVVSTTDATEFAHAVNRATGLPFVVSAGGATIATGAAGASSLDLSGEGPRTENVDLPSGDFRARIVSLPDAEGDVRAALLGPRESGFSGGQALVAVILVALVLLAVALLVPLVRDLRRQHERTEEEAITDELTGLSNHRRFRQILSKEVERARRFDRPLSVVMLDLDDFKEINDTYGHLQGDRVLREVGRVLRSESREVDEPARYGGEEFAIALPETRIDGAMEVGERIRRRLDGIRIPLDGDGEIAIRASVGVAGSPEQPADTRTLIKAADQALYRAKQQGKNRTARAVTGRAPEAVPR